MPLTICYVYCGPLLWCLRSISWIFCNFFLCFLYLCVVFDFSQLLFVCWVQLNICLVWMSACFFACIPIYAHIFILVHFAGVRGLVSDGKDGQPLTNYTIEVDNDVPRKMTGGRFYLPIPAGYRMITVNAPGQSSLYAVLIATDNACWCCFFTFAVCVYIHIAVDLVWSSICASVNLLGHLFRISTFWWTIWSKLVLWLECRFLDSDVDGSNPGISMLCPWARHFICISSVDSAENWIPGGHNHVKGVQCYELFRGIARKNHAFFLSRPRIL